jgi:hypothetical protein
MAIKCRCSQRRDVWKANRVSYLEDTIAALSEQYQGTDGAKRRANEIVKAINDYIIILCGPPMPDWKSY